MGRLPHVPPYLRHDLFRAGWNAVQVQKFLGHSDPGFTLRTYVHLLPEDLPVPPFGDDLTAADRDTAIVVPEALAYNQAG